jgi:hypothetical protein
MTLFGKAPLWFIRDAIALIGVVLAYLPRTLRKLDKIAPSVAL